MTRKERTSRALRIAEHYFSGGADAPTREQAQEAVEHALGGPCPAWWAEHVYEERAREREYREELRA